MIKGGRALTVAGCIAAAACAQTQSVKVRAIADPAKKERFGGGLLADARAQLALGDVGIALETFQTLARQQPENPDAYAGIAACYEAMGRFDIARQNYELALAFAPNDPALLLSLAGSLDHLGATGQASQVRAEAARQRMTPAAPVAVTPPAVQQLAAVTVKLPPPLAMTPVNPSAKRPPPGATASIAAGRKTVAPAKEPHELGSTAAPSSTTNTPSLARKFEARSSARMEAAAAALPPAQDRPLAAVTVSSAPNALKTAALADAKIALPLPLGELLTNPLGTSPALSARGKSVPLPAVRDAHAAPGAANKESLPTIPPARPADRDRLPAAAVAPVESRVESGARLRRVSQSEVSLVTTQQPVRYAQLANPAALSAPKVPSEVAINTRRLSPTPQLASTLHWVPLKSASATDNIQLLNAARSQSLAAHVRNALLNKGWRKIGIGNAPIVRQHSLVLYSPARARLARRLAAQFHCKALQTRGIKSVLVLLGRDAALARRPVERA